MALLWVEGFETYRSSVGSVSLDDLRRKYTNCQGGSPEIAAGRTGGFSYRVGSSASAGTIVTPNIADDDEIIVGLAIKFGDISVTNHSIITVLDDLRNQKFILSVTSDGELTVSAPGSGHAISESTSGLDLQSDTWYYIELYCLFHASAGQWIVRVDETEVLNTDSVDTLPTGVELNWSAIAFNFENVTVTANGTFMDDIYVLDGSGSTNNSFLGIRKVVALFPSGDSSVNFSPASNNYTRINSQEYDDTESVESSTTGHADLYTYDDLPENAPVDGIAVITAARKNDAQFMSLISKSRSDVTDSDGAALSMSADFVEQLRIIELDPDSLTPWTKTTLDTALFGFEVD